MNRFRGAGLTLPHAIATLSIAGVVTASGLLAAAGAQDAPLFEMLCVARDDNMTQIIEQHRAARDVHVEVLADASAVLVLARKACARGEVGKALLLYDSIRLRRDVLGSGQ